MWQPKSGRGFPTFEELVRELRRSIGERGDARALIGIAQWIIGVTPRLRGIINRRKMALTSFDWDIVPHDKADAERAEMAKKRLLAVIRQVVQGHVQVPLYGAYLAELDWKTNPEKPKIVKVWNPAELKANGEDSTEMEIYEKEGGKWTLRKWANDNEAQNGLYPRFLHQTDGDLFRGGLMRGIGVYECLGNEARIEWANFNNQLKGIVHVTYDQDKVTYDADGNENSGLEPTKEALTNARRNGWVATDNAIEMKLQNLVSANGNTSFKEFIEECKSSSAISIVGEANTTELPSGGGSRAALQVQSMISKDIMWDDMSRVESLINEQLLQIDWAINGSTSTDCPYQFKFIWEGEEDRLTNARIIVDAKDAGLPLKRSEVYNKIGFTVPDDDDDVLFSTPIPVI